ncbi:MAG TPA: amidohydrolase family protein [Acidimicrobiales bacterium]|nr:amidohydrolase family protein [Acidimicrobiales bacterium]
MTGLTNVSVRLEEMDALNIDVQVLISSIFIAMTIDHPLREAAITRSYNRWVAERSADAGGRLPWLVVPPTGSVDRALEEIEFGRNHGAVGVMLKGVEHGMYLDDPYFDPLYAKIQDLDMVVGVHAGINTRDVKDLPLADLIPTPAALLDHVLGPMKGLHAVLSSNIEQRFPRLRWAFLETGSTWVPAVFQQHQRLMSTSRPDGFVRGDDGVGVVIDHFKVAEIMEKKQLFVACETDEDLPYLTALLGPSQLVFGSDYCHNDAGSDPLGHSVIRSRTDLAPEIANAIVDGNGRKLLGIDENFCPAPATRPERVDLPAG